MKIGIFGGSFNPIHVMHEKMATTLIKNNYVDKVIFVPTGSKYEYKNNLIADKDRLNMIKLITDKYDYLDYSSYELQDKVIYTYQTLDYFREKYPKDEVYFICGSDNLSYIDKWMRGEYILSNYKIIVIKRCGDNINDLLLKYKDYKNNIIVSNILEENVSSTEIRNNIKSGREIFNLDKKVIDYININNLYR